MRTDSIEVNGKKYTVEIRLESRNDCSASIRRRGVTIRLPVWLSRDEMARQTLEMKMWAVRKIAERPERLQPIEQKTYSHGDRLKVGDEEYTISICHKDKAGSSAKIHGNDIYLTLSSNVPEDERKRHTSALLGKCVAMKRIGDLKIKIDELNRKHFNQAVGKITFKNNRSNWGSCSRAGNINISTRLLFAPTDVLEYVCIHELAHLAELNHSDKFWSLVENAMPDYREKERWLKENRGKCAF